MSHPCECAHDAMGCCHGGPAACRSLHLLPRGAVAAAPCALGLRRSCAPCGRVHGRPVVAGRQGSDKKVVGAMSPLPSDTVTVLPPRARSGRRAPNPDAASRTVRNSLLLLPIGGCRARATPRRCGVRPVACPLWQRRARAGGRPAAWEAGLGRVVGAVVVTAAPEKPGGGQEYLVA